MLGVSWNQFDDWSAIANRLVDNDLAMSKNISKLEIPLLNVDKHRCIDTLYTLSRLNTHTHRQTEFSNQW